MDLDSSSGDAWLLDALGTSPLFAATSPPPWPFGDQHSPSPMDTATAATDEAPSTRSGEFSDPTSILLVRISILPSCCTARFAQGCSDCDARVLSFREKLNRALLIRLIPNKANFFSLTLRAVAVWVGFDVFYALEVSRIGGLLTGFHYEASWIGGLI